MVEKHTFKAIYSEDEEVYRIIDLTDLSIVGMTEMHVNWDETDREYRAALNKDIKAKKKLGVKVVSYGIFILYDSVNSKPGPHFNGDYVRSVLKQMAIFFKEHVIANDPSEFEEFFIPAPKKKASCSSKGSDTIDNLSTNSNKITVSPKVEKKPVEKPGKINGWLPSLPIEKKNRKNAKSDNLFWGSAECVTLIVGLSVCVIMLIDGLVFDSWLMDKLTYAFVYILSGFAFLPSLF